LLDDVHRELSSISRTLRVTLEKAGDDLPERYFTDIGPEVSSFANILGIVFFDREGKPAFTALTLDNQPLPQVNVQDVIFYKTPTEGVFNTKGGRRYYRVEPIISSTGKGIGAFLLLEDFPVFTREFRSRALQTLLSTLALLAIVATVASLVVHRSVTLPLQTFALQTADIGQGHFDQHLHQQFPRHDEIGLLAEEFDRMCQQLQEARQQLLAESEEKLRLAHELRQSEKLATVGQFAARLAHEIGTPLNIVRGRAQQLLQRESIDDKQRVFLTTIVAQIERISRFVRQLLSMAQRSEPRLRATHINEVVQRMWDTVGERSVTSGVDVQFALASGLPQVLADPDQLQQVFLNLYVNAVQAVGAAGTVKIETKLAASDETRLPKHVEIIVTDTGPGIAPRDIPRIFEPFFTTKSMAEGSGLGLAISQDIILAHHGHIAAESTFGVGSRFIVTLLTVDITPTAEQQMR
jgi:signal transduction histidine kinase